jgi:hypothetical protein
MVVCIVNAEEAFGKSPRLLARLDGMPGDSKEGRNVMQQRFSVRKR